jgi:Tfp pilus assembly protein PilX
MDRQKGATLIVALVLLVLLTLLAVTGLNTSTTNLKIVGNMQARSEAVNAAQEAIENVISTPTFISSPSNAVLAPCGAANTLCTDVTGDGVADYTTVLSPAPACVSVRSIQMSELNFSNSEDVGCAQQQSQNLGVSGATSGNSLCAATIWEINAQTTASSGNATATVTQGVSVRISADDTATSCM